MVPSRAARGEGNETLGSPRPGFLKSGNCVLAFGTGLELNQPGKITVELNAELKLEQVILYWGLRSSQGDPEVIVNDTLRVRGELIGTSNEFPGADTRPFVYRADVTGLNLVKPGEKREVAVKGLDITDTGVVNGAELVLILSDGSKSSFEVRDGNDFAYWKFLPPVDRSVRQKFTYEAVEGARKGELVLVVGDHKAVDQAKIRPSTLEVAIDGAPLQVISDPLKGSDGDSWDTLVLPLALPGGSKSVEVQLFSDTRTGGTLSPSSFYWLFASLKVERPMVPENLSIAGAVYCDTNGNSQRDSGEKGIAGAELTLGCTHNGSTTKRSSITDANGHYVFGDIPPGSNCTVLVVPGVALVGKEPTEVCQPITNLRQNVTDCDFGYALPPRVGDSIFFDLDCDGAQQANEPGLAGVKVSIVAPAGGGFPGYSTSTVSDRDGKYLFFIPGVPGSGTVVATVSIDPMTGDARGKALTTDNPQQTIPLGPGGLDLARDFGLCIRAGDARVGDTVFCDNNGNARQDDGEQGLAGVKVSIQCPAGEGFPGVNLTTTTDSQGKYAFVVQGIPADKKVVCSVSIDSNSGDAKSKDLTTPNPQNTAPLGALDVDNDRDFGLKPRMGDAIVGDTVYCDLNGNGQQDPGEPGIRDVPVTLAAQAGGGFTGVNLSARTDANGKYLFVITGIPFGGTVVATVTVDTNSLPAQNKVLSTPNPQSTIPLSPNVEDRNRDFGLKPLAARVGDTVFCDTNGNGMLDVGEPGLSGVKVSINAPAVGAFGGYSNSTTTDALGHYLFTLEGIPPETPVVGRVEVDPRTGGAAGLEITTPGSQQTVALGPAGQDLNRDFGFRCGPVRVKTCLEQKTVAQGDCVNVRVLLSSTHPVEGFSTSVRHNPEVVQLDSMTILGTESATNEADFTSFEVFEDGGTGAVILDLQAPFNGNTIPAGTDRSVLIYRYCCNPIPAGSASRTTELTFVDDVFGTPRKDNSVVIGGKSYTPEFCAGSITCETPDDDCTGKPYFLCGGPKLGTNKKPLPIRGAPGDSVELSFYYCSPEDNKPGHPQFDQLQGLSIAVCYDCRLECIESSFRTPPDTMTDALKAEFVSFQCDNDPADGDGCELILAILIDVLEPFDGRTFPPTDVPLKLGTVEMKVSDEVSCGTCLPVRFCDGINGRGLINTKNLYAAENQSFKACTEDCEICVVGSSGFRRGDCNSDGKTNLSDAAAIVYRLLSMDPSGFEPPCLDACDANDDGRLDLADAIKILAWLFQRAEPPPAPGPLRAGKDPTPDNLSCEAFGGCQQD